MADDRRRTTDRDRANVRGSQGEDGEPMEPSNTAGTEDLGGPAVMSVQGGTRAPEDWGGAGVTEDQGGRKAWCMHAGNPVEP